MAANITAKADVNASAMNRAVDWLRQGATASAAAAAAAAAATAATAAAAVSVLTSDASASAPATAATAASAAEAVAAVAGPGLGGQPVQDVGTQSSISQQQSFRYVPWF